MGASEQEIQGLSAYSLPAVLRLFLDRLSDSGSFESLVKRDALWSSRSLCTEGLSEKDEVGKADVATAVEVQRRVGLRFSSF